jgi:hypothetical protein
MGLPIRGGHSSAGLIWTAYSYEVEVPSDPVLGTRNQKMGRVGRRGQVEVKDTISCSSTDRAQGALYRLPCFPSPWKSPG